MSKNPETTPSHKLIPSGAPEEHLDGGVLGEQLPSPPSGESESPRPGTIRPRSTPDSARPESKDRSAPANPPDLGAPATLQLSILRSIFLGIWFFVVPMILAWLTVELLKSDQTAGSPPLTLGWLRWQLHDQWVPALIACFTAFEMGIYQMRHALPGARSLGIGGRTDVPRHMRQELEQAHHLLEEASRVLRRNRKSIESHVPRAAREDLAVALEELRDQLDRSRFDEEQFVESFERAGQLFSRHLGRWRKSELREYAESIIVAVAVALLLRAFVVEAFKIPSGSMLPTLQIQDHIFVNKLAYGPPIPFTESRLWNQLPPHRADVMVFEFPGDRSQDFIKRVIALPGDELRVDAGHPIINGWRVPSCKVGMLDYPSDNDGRIQKRGELDIEFLGDYSYLTLYEEDRAPKQEGPYHVKPGEVWVLGDNRNNSSDSRAWNNEEGAGVPFPLIKGRAMFVWLSFTQGSSINFRRMLHNVMGKPALPQSQATPELQAGIERCLAERPAVTLPPPAP